MQHLRSMPMIKMKFLLEMAMLSLVTHLTQVDRHRPMCSGIESNRNWITI
jgi:hypothetical protein